MKSKEGILPGFSSMARRLHSQKTVGSSIWKKLMIWVGGIVVLALTAFFFLGQVWVENYLGGLAFRKQLSARLSQALRAKVEVESFKLRGNQVFSSGIRGQGGEDAKFTKLEVDDIRAETELSLSRFWYQNWEVQNVEIQRLKLDFTGERLTLNLPPRERTHERKLKISSITVRDFSLAWHEGGLQGLELVATPDGDSWILEGHEGKVIQAGFPDAGVLAFRARRQADSFFVQKAELKLEGGLVEATAEIVSGGDKDIEVKFKDVGVTAFLPEDWRARLHGVLTGEAALRFTTAGTLEEVRGKIRMDRGILEGLPVLDKIAKFTKVDRFRKINLSRTSAEFRRTKEGVRISNMIGEADAFMLLKGNLDIKNGELAGDFEIGLTPSALQWLPGSQEKVFTVTKDGYACTTMHVSGSLDHPKEDLSRRLALALGEQLGEELFERASEAAGSATGAAQKAVQGVLESGLNFLK